MSIFQDVTLTYKEKEYKVKASDVMRLIAKIESVITIGELASEKGPPMSSLSMAYGVALRFAGANVEDEEIYQSIYSENGASSASSAVTGLISLMIPPNTKTTPVKKKRAKKK